MTSRTKTTPYARLPFGPLHAAAVAILDTHVDDVNDQHVADVLGISHDLVGRYRRRGWLPDDVADRVAVHIGRHPAELWPVEWANLDELADQYRAERAALTRATKARNASAAGVLELELALPA